MKNPIYKIITFISLINISVTESYIHQGIGHGTHYFSNLREPYMDLSPVSINRGIKFSNQCVNDILKKTKIDIDNDYIRILYENLDYRKYGETMREINAFSIKLIKIIKTLIVFL